MAEEKDLWTLSAGEQHRASGKNRSASYMFANMDELVASGNGQPLVIDADDEKVLNKAADYAAQKGYDLVSPDPEQNLKIMAKQNAMAGEEIAEGQLEPSSQLQIGVAPQQGVAPENADVEKQKALERLGRDKEDLYEFDRAIDYSDDPRMRERERAESAKKHAEIAARETEYQEKGWLPTAEKVKRVETDDPAADIAKIAEQTKALPDPFAQQAPAGVQSPHHTQDLRRPQDFPEKRPAEVLAHRWGVPRAKDHGNRIVVTRMGMLAVTPPQQRERHDLVSAALLKSRERFGEPVRVTGNKAFENAVIKAAIEQGIPLEMGSDRGEKAYALALQNEKKRGLEKSMGQLAPSKEREKALQGAALQAAALPGATPEKAKGKGRELGM